jgi:hypothetical protein
MVIAVLLAVATAGGVVAGVLDVAAVHAVDSHLQNLGQSSNG